MIPPTSIDGTDITGATIDGTDVTEITVDGDEVFSAFALREDFEHNNLAGEYQGDLSLYSITSTTVDAGNFALEATGTESATESIVRTTTNSFNRFGEKIEYRFAYDSNNGIGGLAFVEDGNAAGSSLSGYVFRHSDPKGQEIIRFDNGNFNRLLQDSIIPNSTNYVDASVEFFQNDDITFTIDGNSITVNDNTYTDGRIGFECFRGPMFFDTIGLTPI